MGLQSVPEGVFLARTLPIGMLAVMIMTALSLIFTLGGVAV